MSGTVMMSGFGVQLLGGYLYFHKAPNAQEFFEETRDKVRNARRRNTAVQHGTVQNGIEQRYTVQRGVVYSTVQ